MTNFVEAGKAAESLTDDGLRKAANFGHPIVPPIVALTEITRRKDMRQRYNKARNKMPEATIKDQILGENPLDGGVMSNVPQMPQQMPQQMASRSPMPQPPMQPPMNPQMMAQRPPVSSQMRPQGMMPQMASTGAVVRANQGMPIDYMGDLERLNREIMESRERVGLSNEYLRPSDENIRPSEILNPLGTGEGIRPSETVNPLGTGEGVEPYLNPSDQGIGKGNAVIEDALKFNPSSVDELFRGERGMEGDAGLFDPDSKTLREQIYGGEQKFTSAKPNQQIITSITPNDPPPKPVTGVADPYTKDILQAAKAEAFQLTDEDIAAFTPSKDDILSGFLMNYGASLAGGDHAGGLKKGIASVAKDRKLIRSGSQLKALANIKAKQAQATARVDALYKAGSLDINELTANVSNNVEKGRLIRAYSEDIRRVLSDRQEMERLRNSSDPDEQARYKKIMEQAAEVRELMSIMANRNLQTISQGGIVSVI